MKPSSPVHFVLALGLTATVFSVGVSSVSRLVAKTILHPPLPSPVIRPLMETVTFTSVGFLPP